MQLLQHVQRRYKAANDETIPGRVSTFHLLVELNVPVVIARDMVQVTDQDIMDYLLNFLFPGCDINPDAIVLKQIEEQEKLHMDRLCVMEKEGIFHD